MILTAVFEDKDMALKEATYKYLLSRFEVKDLRDVIPLCFSDYKLSFGRGRQVHTGKVDPSFELNELQISMICDGGYNHFGGVSTLFPDLTFKVEIYLD